MTDPISESEQTSNLRWLHLSDIHFWGKNDWKDDAARRKLLDLLKTRFANGLLPKPDFIFCTGDIAQGETRPAELVLQYQSAQTFFDQVLNVCGLAKNRLFVVPGNHDVNRRNVSPKFQKSLVKAGLAEIETDWADANADYEQTIKRMAEYGQFVDAYLPHQAAAAMDRHSRHCYAKVITVNQRRIGIGGFNSAWSCYDDNDQNHLWMAAEWQFNAADKAFSGETDLRIGLMHHPVSWFQHEEASLAKQRIRAGFDFWLHGHEHVAWVMPTDREIVICAGAVNAGSDAEFGINLVDLNLAEGTGEVHLFSYQTGGNTWLAKNGDDAPNGVREIGFGKRAAVPEKLPPSPLGSPLTAPSKKAKEAKESKVALELLAWCDRDKFIEQLDTHLLQPQPPAVTLFCVADHVNNCTRVVMQRIHEQLADLSRSKRKIKPNRLIHIEKSWQCATSADVGHAICDANAVDTDAELLQKLSSENLAVHLICGYLNCSNLSGEEICNSLNAVSLWVNEVNNLVTTPCKLVLVLVLQYGDRPNSWWARIVDRAAPLVRIKNAYAQVRKKGSLTQYRIDELLILKPYEAKDFRSWVASPRVKKALGSIAEELANEHFIRELFKDGTCSFAQLQQMLEQQKN